MKPSRRTVVTIGVAAIVLAISITSLATGVSLRKLVKKEVAKQLAGKSGPQGPQGAQGTQGIQGPPGQAGPTAKVQLGASTNPNTTNNTPLTVAFDAEDYDASGMHSTTVNPSRVTIPVAGVYEVDLNVVWPNNNVGARLAAVHKSAGGAVFQASQDGATSAATFQSFSDQLRLAAGDYLELKVVQGSGGDLLLIGGGVGGTTMAVTWIAP